jgi:hypothetical protein
VIEASTDIPFDNQGINWWADLEQNIYQDLKHTPETSQMTGGL